MIAAESDVMPSEYIGREQTWLKHRVLYLYLEKWAHKVGSTVARQAGRGRRLKLWYVDCFAGPWMSSATDLRDTSVAIGLKTLQAAQAAWRERGQHFDLGALFVEKDAKAYLALKDLVAQRRGEIDAHTFHGEFGEHIEQIERRIGQDPAFLLVDPTGWDGAAMAYIKPLMRPRMRDVMVNVMFDFINRFKDDPRAFLRAQMKAFFGLGDADLPGGLSEERLIEVYRQRMGSVCGLPFVADLAIPFPEQDRTKFRLVVGGRHREILRLFRDVEYRVVGREAAVVQTEAQAREREVRTSQMDLFSHQPPDQSRRYADDHKRDLEAAESRVIQVLTDLRMLRYDDLWPRVLADHHVREADVGEIVARLREEGRVQVDGLSQRAWRVKDDHLLRFVVGR